MNYINPYSLLQLDSHNTKKIHIAKIELLAKIARMPDGVIDYKGNEIDIHTAASLVGEVENALVSDFHLFIKNNSAICTFLEEGESDFFDLDYDNFLKQSSFGEPAFLNFIKPYLSTAFQKAFDTSYARRDVKILLKMQAHELYQQLGKRPLVIAKVKKILEQEVNVIKKTYKVICHPEATEDIIDVELDNARKAINIEALNALPEQLIHFNNSIALLCCSIAKMLFKKGDDDAIDFFEFADIAHSLKTNGHATNMVKQTYALYKWEYYNILGINVPAHKPNKAKLPKEIYDAVSEINDLKNEFEGRTFEQIGLTTTQSHLACAILHKLSTSQFLEYIAMPPQKEIRQTTLGKVYLILNKTRKFNRTQSLNILQLYRPVFEREAHFVDKYEELIDKIERSVDRDIVDGNKKELNPIKEIVQEYTVKPKAQAKKYSEQFTDWMKMNTSDINKLALLLPLIPVLFVGGLLIMGSINFLTSKVELSETQIALDNKRIYKYNTKDYKKEKFYVNRHLYKGNQLKTGSIPFEQCFGAGTMHDTDNNTLVFTNESPEDMVLCVYDKETNYVVRQTYVRAYEASTMKQIPSGKYIAKMYIGKDWNPEWPNFCSLYGGFETNAHYVKLKNKFPIELKGANTKHLEFKPIADDFNEHFLKMSASGYFNFTIRNRK